MDRGRRRVLRSALRDQLQVPPEQVSDGAHTDPVQQGCPGRPQPGMTQTLALSPPKVTV